MRSYHFEDPNGNVDAVKEWMSEEEHISGFHLILARLSFSHIFFTFYKVAFKKLAFNHAELKFHTGSSRYFLNCGLFCKQITPTEFRTVPYVLLIYIKY